MSFLKPMLATSIEEPFNDKKWLFEIKLDGFRAFASLSGAKVSLYSRNFQSFNTRFPLLVQELKSLKLHAIFDGEIVALDKKGISHFQKLQKIENEESIYYYIFDILYFNGRDLRNQPLIERKSLLKNLLKETTHLRYLDHIEEKGKRFFTLCKKKGLEGIMAKERQSRYTSGQRSKEWLKIKCEQQQEVVIGGFSAPRGSRKHFGALLVGVYEGDHLRYVAHVGGGFTEEAQKEVMKLMKPLIVKQSPFMIFPKTTRGITWIKPELLCEVKFKEWTEGGHMRMPIYLGIRFDKPAKSVRQETSMTFITNREKLYWKKEKITKGMLLEYYETIAPYILPYLKDRPETLKRFPEGIEKLSFFQKNITQPPAWLKTVSIAHTDRDVNYMLIQNKKALLYAVNLGCIEIHPWFSRIKNLEFPDFLIFDLDPVEISFDAVVETALALHALLKKIKVPCFCKTSGGRGMHIGVPLGAHYSYEQAKNFAVLIATLINQELPKITSLERSPQKRKRRVYIDCYQNNFGQTLAAPFSVRAKAGAPVSMPLFWEEVKKGMDPKEYHLFNTLERVKSKGDPFKSILHRRGVHLEKALERLQKFYD